MCVSVQLCFSFIALNFSFRPKINFVLVYFKLNSFFFVGENNKNNNKVKLIILTAESRAGGLRQKYNNEK